jgi:hypothetical protein
MQEGMYYVHSAHLYIHMFAKAYENIRLVLYSG